MKKLIALVLAGVMLFLNAGTVFGEELYQNTMVHVNPLYAEDSSAEGLLTDLEQCSITAFEEPEYTSDKSAIADTIREAMVDREDAITVYYTQKGDLDDQLLDELMEMALAETGDPKEGDYLRWHYESVSASINGWIQGNVGNYSITLRFKYYTTAKQEAVVTKTIAKTLAQIGVSEELSDYENVKKIYDYICSNVTYDYANLDNERYKLKYTAYAALIDGTAVCQGYSSLLYRMLREIGIDTRVITGVSFLRSHAWNIVELDDKYYYLDSTWDSARKKYEYFLKGSDDFEDHISAKEYTTNEFKKMYPISRSDYEIYEIISFDDINENDWYYGAVQYVASHKLMTGMSETTFGPVVNLGRAQFAVILHRMNGAPEMPYKKTFADVPDDTWYTDAVLWANEKGIITGYTNGLFGAADNITREQMALMMFRYANSMKYETGRRADFGKFKDAASVSGFAQDAMKWAVGNSIITGKNSGTALDPQGNASRAECATIIMRFMKAYTE